jgi:protein-disulfide isomerase
VSTRARTLIVAAAALIVVVVAVVISQSGGDGTADVSDDASELVGTLEGIPQDGFSIGEPDAPVRMLEYGDLQCPFCADAATESIPTLIDEYVATGDLRITFSPVAFIGTDSIEAAQMAAAAALQDRGFAFVELFYEQQGRENSGYVTNGFLRQIAEQIPGLDVDRALAHRSSAEVQAMLDEASTAARRDGVNSTPSFLLARGDGQPELIDVAPDDVDGFRSEIDNLLSG